ncbi:MAG TPA: hypothetical protein VHX66_10965 [Solirubrobacteraceae bacterium]|nr:hypothetical protein [Solirubrobacteraceae bacterium]
MVLTSLLAGCGGGSSVPPARQRAAIRATVRTFMRELAIANGKVACEGLTVAGSQSVIATIGPELGNFGINSCAQVVSLTGGQLSAALRRELASVTVGAVALHGSNATVRWSAVTSRFGDVAAYFGHPKAMILSEIRGFWYINRL